MSKIRLTAERLNPQQDMTSDDSHIRELTSAAVIFEEDFTGHELNIVCRRLAAALGYGPETIEQSFAPMAEDRYNDHIEDFSIESILKKLDEDGASEQVTPPKEVKTVSVNFLMELIVVLRYYATVSDTTPEAALSMIKKIQSKLQ